MICCLAFLFDLVRCCLSVWLVVGLNKLSTAGACPGRRYSDPADSVGAYILGILHIPGLRGLCLRLDPLLHMPEVT
jgi:hypothetical protein